MCRCVSVGPVSVGADVTFTVLAGEKALRDGISIRTTVVAIFGNTAEMTAVAAVGASKSQRRRQRCRRLRVS